VTLAAQGDLVRVGVRDDGAGLPGKGDASSGHYGVIGMKERAREIGAELALTSDAARGTEVEVSLPLGPAEGPGGARP
jgi:signal transduction histidine kinase